MGPSLTPVMLGECVYEVECMSRRTSVVRLLPSGFQERKLRRLANLCVKLINEINYERKRQFFKGEKVDFKDAWVKYYEKCTSKYCAYHGVEVKRNPRGVVNCP